MANFQTTIKNMEAKLHCLPRAMQHSAQVTLPTTPAFDRRNFC